MVALCNQCVPGERCGSPVHSFPELLHGHRAGMPSSQTGHGDPHSAAGSEPPALHETEHEVSLDGVSCSPCPSRGGSCMTAQLTAFLTCPVQAPWGGVQYPAGSGYPRGGALGSGCRGPSILPVTAATGPQCCLQTPYLAQEWQCLGPSQALHRPGLHVAAVAPRRLVSIFNEKLWEQNWRVHNPWHAIAILSLAAMRTPWEGKGGFAETKRQPHSHPTRLPLWDNQTRSAERESG